MKYCSFFSSARIGLAIHGTKLQLVQLRKRKGQYALEAVYACDMPDGIIEEEKIKHWDKLATLVASLVQAQGLQGIATAIALPSHLVRTQQMALPIGLSEEEVAAEMVGQVQRDLPGVTDTLCFDYAKLPSTQSDCVNYLMTTAKQAYVAAYVACIHQSGLQVKVVDVDSYALQRAVYFASPVGIKHGEVHAILQLLHDAAVFIIFTEQQIIFDEKWRVIPDRLIEQVKYSVDICMATTMNKQFSSLSLCGSNMHVDSELLASALHCPVYSIDVFKHAVMMNQLRTESLALLSASDFTVAYGLALGEMPRW